MTMIEAFVVCMTRYVDFSGRASRQEFWKFQLAVFLLSIVTTAVDRIVFGDAGFLTIVLGVATFLPNLASWVRRLHDTGRSGWWFLITMIPLVGLVWLVVLCCQASEPRRNEYGS